MNEGAIRDAITKGNRADSFKSVGELESVIRWIASDALKFRGQTMSDDVLKACAKKLAEVILRDYPSLTDKEVELIMEAGVSGEFGKDTWVSGASMLQWLRAYSRNVTHLAVIDEQTEKMQKKFGKTKAEIDKLNQQSINAKVHSAFEYYKESGSIFGDDPRAFHIPQMAAIVYEHYRRSGQIPEPSQEILEKANDYANNKVIERSTKFELIPGAKKDWMEAYLLENYFNNVINRKR